MTLPPGANILAVCFALSDCRGYPGHRRLHAADTKASAQPRLPSGTEKVKLTGLAHILGQL